MCVNCVTQTESVVFAGVGVVAMASAVVDKLQSLLQPETWAVKRQRAWEANVAFFTSMGLDPDTVLGPPPKMPSTATRDQLEMLTRRLRGPEHEVLTAP